MSEKVLTFDLCTIDNRGAVHFSAEGFQVVQALLMKYIIQAERGESAALELAGGRMDGYAVNQVGYWRAAKTFLLGKLCGQFHPRTNLRETLAEIARWSESDTIPGRWQEAITDSRNERGEYGIVNSATGGSGSDSDGGDGIAKVATGHVGEMVQKPTEPAAHGDDHRESGIQTESAIDVPRKKRSK